MTTFRLLAVLTLFWLAVSADSSAQESLWTSTREKLASSGYSVTCDYDGPEGNYQFNYVVEGERILTEVLAGSARGAGARILYDPAADRENVKLKTDMFSLRRSLQARDIKDSPLYQSLFEQMLDQFVEPFPRETRRAGQGTLFLFGKEGGVQDILEVDEAGDPLNVRRLEKGKEIRRMSFRDLTWGKTAIVWP
jgi:hypothetical protein